MKYVISVSKTYKHRGKFIVHREKTKKHWQIMYYEHDEDDNLQLYSKFVNPITAFYYKFHKYKKIHLTCPDCKTTYLHLIKKRTEKEILNSECPDCLESFRDVLETIENP